MTNDELGFFKALVDLTVRAWIFFFQTSGHMSDKLMEFSLVSTLKSLKSIGAKKCDIKSFSVNHLL